MLRLGRFKMAAVHHTSRPCLYIWVRVEDALCKFSCTHTNCQLVWGVTFDPTTLEHSLCLVEQFLWTPTNWIRLSSRISGPGPSTEDHPHSLKLPPPSFFPVTLRATHVPSRGEFLGWLSAQFLHIYIYVQSITNVPASSSDWSAHVCLTCKGLHFLCFHGVIAGGIWRSRDAVQRHTPAFRSPDTHSHILTCNILG